VGFSVEDINEELKKCVAFSLERTYQR